MKIGKFYGKGQIVKMIRGVRKSFRK